MIITKIGKWGGLFILALVLVFIYWFFDPAESQYFPACPFYSITALECPGCGSQRAAHHLLNFEFAKAFDSNGLFVLSIPYVLLGLYLDRIAPHSEQNEFYRKVWFGRNAIYMVLVTILGFWIFRNI